jgi:hypothetical protein
VYSGRSRASSGGQRAVALTVRLFHPPEPELRSMRAARFWNVAYATGRVDL